MSTEKSSPKISILRSESVVLIILTAMTYTAFLVREMGYADFYFIPYYLISSSHIGLVSAAQALAWGLLLYITKVNFVLILTPHGERLVFQLVRLAIGSILLMGFAFYPYLATGLSWWWFAGAMAPILLVISLTFFVPFQGEVEGYENKVEKQFIETKCPNDPYWVFLQHFDRATVITFCLIVAMIAFAYGDGRRSAIEEEVFNLVEGEPNVALLRIYGEIAVLVTFDPKAHQLSGLVRLAKLPDGKGVEFRRTTVGRLKKAEIKK